jgi:hypothetical protein
VKKPGGEWERSGAETCFINERLLACRHNGQDVEDALHHAIVDLLRQLVASGVAPSRNLLARVAAELERLYWPKAYNAQRRRDRAQAKLMSQRALIDHVAEKYRGASDPRTKAAKDVAKRLGIKTSTLQRQRTRYRQRAV